MPSADATVPSGVGDFVYGFQCHMEFNRAVVEGLIEHSVDEFFARSRRRFVQQPEELPRNGYEAMNDTLFSFLDRLTADYCATSADLRT